MLTDCCRLAYGTEQMSRPAAARFAVLAIGDEVLRGEVVNGNAVFLSERLFTLGCEPTEHAVVSDDPAAIRAALSRLGASVDILLVTGGLGPTDDDRTVDVVTGMLGVAATSHEPSLIAMQQRFEKLGFELTPNNLRQVRVPEGAVALQGTVGIAPGFCVRIGGADAYFLPGVPREAEQIFADHVSPRIAAKLASVGVDGAIVRTWHVYGMGESHIDHRLAGLIDGLAGATLHFRTAAPENHVRVVLRGLGAAQGRAQLDRFDGEIRHRLGPVISGVDDDTFVGVVGKALRAAGATLGLAESCTGGYAGQLLTAEPGASDFFRGAVVAYSNDVKINVLGVPREVITEHGAVSEPVARAMAEGARKVLGAKVAVSITGVAGRDVHAGGAKLPEPPLDKPVGTVCFAVAGEKSTRAVTKVFSMGRERIRRSAAFFALDLARHYVS